MFFFHLSVKIWNSNYQTINLYIGGNKIKRFFIGRTCHIYLLHLHVTFICYMYE
jgi:hypothetical protein